MGMDRLSTAWIVILRIDAASRCFVLVLAALLATNTFAQDPNTDRNPGTLNVQPHIVYQTNPGTSVAVFKVFGEKLSTPLDRQALLKMVNIKDQTVRWATTESESQGAFTNIPFGNYDVDYLRHLWEVIREAGHPSVRPMLDFYHFWSGLGKFEDLTTDEPLRWRIPHALGQSNPERAAKA